MLPDGRLHLQHGPIDLIVQAEGQANAVRDAFAALTAWFASVLDELCQELPALRRPARAGLAVTTGPVARRMEAAVSPHAASGFITPMAAVAGAVADQALAIMREAAALRRTFVNNGGDIALHLSAGQCYDIGLVDRPDRPGLFARARIAHADGIAGIATSGWRGRSFSFGVADAVTVCAASAAQADAAATVVANAVALPGHRAVHRVPATTVQPDSDLGCRPVTRGVGWLAPAEIADALHAGVAVAERLIGEGLIAAAALHCQGHTRLVARRAGLLAER